MSERPAEQEIQNIEYSAIRRIRQILIRWGKKNYQDFPWRNAGKKWHALLAEVLLQRTRAKSVVPVYLAFIAKYPEPENLATASVNEIEELIYPLGLKWRASLIQKLGQELVKRGCKVPNNIDELKSLPAVGPYAASAWLSFHGNKRGVIIDANVVRFICRLVDWPMDGETRRKKWLISFADLLTPTKSWREYNYAILDFTMNICAKKALCSKCPIGSQYCLYGTHQLAREGK